MLFFAFIACRPPDLEVVLVEDLGVLETTSAVKARDGGYSVRFGDRSIWLYGDSILSLAGEDGSSWRDNTWSWTEDLDPSDGVTGFSEPVDAAGAPRELFSETPDERAYNLAHADLGEGCAEEPCGGREVLWPMDAVETDAGVLLFYVKIHGEPGPWNFFARGSGVAVWTDFEAGPIRPEPGIVAGDPTLLFGPGEPWFGDAAAVGADGLVYAWGRRDDDGPKRQLLGRVSPEAVNDRGAWRYWDGREFGADLSRAEPVFTGSSQMKVFEDPDLGVWLAVYMAEPWSHLVFRTAPAPEGPWSREERLADTLDAVNGWPYCGLAHPELATDGMQVVTYYRDTGDWTGETRVLRVGLAKR